MKFENLLKFSLQMTERGKSHSKDKRFGPPEENPFRKRRFSTISLPPDFETIAEDQEPDNWSSLQRLHEATCSKFETMTNSQDEEQRKLNKKDHTKSRSMEINNFSNRSLSETKIGDGPSSPYEAPLSVKLQPFCSMSQRRDSLQAFVQPGYLRRAHSDFEIQTSPKTSLGSTRLLYSNPASSSQSTLEKESLNVSSR